ncbi:hypothetical protein [Thermasporomyces composti]|jgi:hypothetical protein|uniref:Mannose-6-phosphate isomerase-like protein (Cupin superfamily) n=1 Tax=Thermasporomyces composti TaxID=696763 RepID=A0A3D9V4F3_THECX|nr:hypothetical protein [Thermasporomyces composti]REF36618.1 hypothetical protein DFJ64_2031 [Thermasporomyces composti]
MDGVIAAPEVFRVLFENDRVRVVEVHIEAGQRVAEHTHRRPSVVVVEQPARLRYHADVHFAGDVEPVAMAGDHSVGDSPGEAVAGLLWSDPVGPHVVENVDDHAFHAVRIELKDVPGETARRHEAEV